MPKSDLPMTALKVSFHTLGCKLNFAETATLARQFSAGGYVKTTDADADIYVINTCTVTEHADKKCRNLIRKLARTNPNAIIAVTGCYAQLKPDSIRQIEGVDIVLGNSSKGELFAQVDELAKKGKVSPCENGAFAGFFSAFSTEGRTRSFLKVQDGCDYKCSYCTIPYARGNSRNISIAEAAEQARAIAATGRKEIVLTGINTGDFGHTTGEKFIDLLKALNEVEGIERYRISSIEPNLLTDEVISFTAASEKFQPHFHIPLQSGCDRILGLMRRRYTTDVFARRIEAVRRVMPNTFFGIDVIVGFPGETDEDFETTYAFLEQIAPSYLHVFPYSDRPLAPASRFDGKVAPQVAADRVKRLTDLSNRMHKRFMEQYLGKEAHVLWESTFKDGKMFGFTENYIRVEAPHDKKHVNRITPVLLTGISEDGNMNGEIIT
jgi:threonylcarbamoyladenosine tRNA methylthiotransferase MtaB